MCIIGVLSQIIIYIGILNINTSPYIKTITGSLVLDHLKHWYEEYHEEFYWSSYTSMVWCCSHLYGNLISMFRIEIIHFNRMSIAVNALILSSVLSKLLFRLEVTLMFHCFSKALGSNNEFLFSSLVLRTLRSADCN